MVAAGQVRAIGVSNFDPQQLRQLLAWARVRPAVVQARSDPYEANRPLQALCRESGIVFQAYSSLVRAGGVSATRQMTTTALLRVTLSKAI